MIQQQQQPPYDQHVEQVERQIQRQPQQQQQQPYHHNQQQSNISYDSTILTTSESSPPIPTPSQTPEVNNVNDSESVQPTLINRYRANSIVTDPESQKYIKQTVSDHLDELVEKQSSREVKEISRPSTLAHLAFYIPRWKSIPVHGDMVRDLNAVESTFLSWMRTAIALIALGIAVVRIVKTTPSHPGFAKAVGAVFISGGLLIFVYSYIRHINTLGRMVEGKGTQFVIDGVTPPLFMTFGIAMSVLALLLIFL